MSICSLYDPGAMLDSQLDTQTWSPPHRAGRIETPRKRTREVIAEFQYDSDPTPLAATSPNDRTPLQDITDEFNNRERTDMDGMWSPATRFRRIVKYASPKAPPTIVDNFIENLLVEAPRKCE
jgi:hypothetical protein